MKALLTVITLVILNASAVVGCGPSATVAPTITTTVTATVNRERNDAIADFAEKAGNAHVELFVSLLDYEELFLKYLIDPNNYPHLWAGDEAELARELYGLEVKVLSVTWDAEKLYAPKEALEAKKILLSQGDMLAAVIRSVADYYAGRAGIAANVLDDAERSLDEWQLIHTELRRQLIDLRLEYGQ